MENNAKYTSPYQLDGRIPLQQALPLGLQHVLAMFVGNFSPLLIIMGTCGLTDGAIFGVLPNTSFSQNVGLVGMTKVVNRFAIAMGAGILVIAGLFPKIGAIINIMPQPVLGGAAIVMFANIVISGINLITKETLDGRNATIVAISLGLGFGLGSATAAQGFMPQWLKYVFGGSGIVPAAILAILLNILIPKDAPAAPVSEEKNG